MAGTMKLSYRHLGSSGLKVSNICLGTMTFGENKLGSPGQCNETLAHSLLDKFVKCGGNFIDTADVYQDGASEEMVGNWLARQKRENIVIATKVRFGWDMENNPNSIGLSRARVLQAAEDSLRRLKTSYIDLYQIHTWDSAVPIEETLAALNDLVKWGKVRYLGACNLTGWQMQKIVEISKRNNYVPWVTLQQQYSLLSRHSEYELMDVCRNEGIGFMPWSPLKGGWLTGKFTRDMTSPPEGTRVAFVEKAGIKHFQSHPPFTEFANDEKVWKILDSLNKIAKAVGKSVAQVAIKWLLQKDTVSSVIIGAKTMKQLDDNLGAGTAWELTQEQMNELDKMSAIEDIYPYEMIKRHNAPRKRNNPCQ